MARYVLAILLALAAAGCQSAGPRVALSREQANQLNFALSGPVAVDNAGKLYLAANSTLIQYDLKRNRLDELLNDPCPMIRGLAVTDDGIVLVLQPRELSAYVAGYLVTLYPLPSDAFALSYDRGFAYVLVTHDEGARLLRIDLEGPSQGNIRSLLTSADRPDALCAVRGGCLVAAGGNIVKVTDPADNGSDSEIATVLLVAMGEPITSVTADQAKRIVYFTTAETTYAWIEGQIVPVFPAGNRLAWNKDTLTICRTGQADSQIIQVPGISRLAGGLVKSLAGGAYPEQP